ncbi:MAG: hypothetical protein H6736_00495 [Alphaproteobacteria bacterium]|nr:hypothetical protein [Alphaproteobacteria bacterium]
MRRSIWFLLILGCRLTGPEGEFHTDSATGMFRAWERRASLGSTVCIASIRNLAERDMDDWFVQASLRGPGRDAANLAPLRVPAVPARLQPSCHHAPRGAW